MAHFFECLSAHLLIFPLDALWPFIDNLSSATILILIGEQCFSACRILDLCLWKNKLQLFDTALIHFVGLACQFALIGPTNEKKRKEKGDEERLVHECRYKFQLCHRRLQ